MEVLFIVLGVLLPLLAFLLLHPSSLLHRLPPGPPAWPVIGSLHLVGKLPHQKLARLAQIYGPIFFLRLGSMPTVVISAPDLAKQVLHAQDHAFSDRPHIEAGNRVFYPDSIFLMHYGPRWRYFRKVCTLELFTSRRLQETKLLRMEETYLMLNNIENRSRNGKLPINLTSWIGEVMADIMCRLLISRKVSENDTMGTPFTEVIHKMGIYLGGPVLGDFIPYLGWLDTKNKRGMDRLHKVIDDLLEKVLAEHHQHKREGPGDLVDVLLSMKNEENEPEQEITNESIKGTLMNLLAAGVDTTAHTVEWAMAELLRNPLVFRKLQSEVDFIMEDPETLVDESNLSKLNYLSAVVKETFRLHPDVPLLLPHLSNRSCEVGGYFIPKKTRVLVNVWAIGRSPSVWKNAEEFQPERFLGQSVDVRGRHLELIPFGAGRRICLGLPLAVILVEQVLANLVRTFDWVLPSNETLEMTECEEFGVATRLAKALVVIPKIRFPAVPKPWTSYVA